MAPQITQLDFFSQKKIPTFGARRWFSGVDETPKIFGVLIWNP